MVMYPIGDLYHPGTEIRIRGGFFSDVPLADSEVSLTVVDAETGDGHDVELAVLQLSGGHWDVRETALTQVIGRKSDGLIFDKERQIPVEGAGVEALASVLAQQYGADQAVILRALKAHRPAPTSTDRQWLWRLHGLLSALATKPEHHVTLEALGVYLREIRETPPAQEAQGQAAQGALGKCHRCHRAVPEVPELVSAPDPSAVEWWLAGPGACPGSAPSDDNEELAPRWWCEDCLREASWEI